MMLQSRWIGVGIDLTLKILSFLYGKPILKQLKSFIVYYFVNHYKVNYFE